MEMNDPRIGLDFGDYKITRKLKEGGMGAVYLAEHEGMYKIVKFILGEAMRQPAIRERFKAECKAVKRFRGPKYPGIVDIDSYGERNGELYLVMEYIDGVTLEDHLRNNVRLTEHHTFHIMLLCLRALSDVHAEGIVHRDLKPSNVFLRQTADRAWDPIIIDFGIVHDNKAPLAGEYRTVAGQLVGTPGYMATEQYGGAHKVTPATDVFACVVMMWEMLTGQLPWGHAPDAFEQYNRQLHHRPIWPAHIPLLYAEGWKEVFEESLSPDPARRPQTAQLLALRLAQRLPPIPPYVPDGLGMVSKLATRFLQDVPAELETVRQPDGRIDVAAFWKPDAAGGTPPRLTPSAINLDAIHVSAVMQAQPAPSAATVNARPQVAAATASSASAASAVPVGAAPMLSTLSAANGSSTTPTTPSRTRLAALGLGAAVAIGGIVFGATRLGSRSSDSPATQPGGAPIGSSPTPSVVAPAPPVAAPATPTAAPTAPPVATSPVPTTNGSATAATAVASEPPRVSTPPNAAAPTAGVVHPVKHTPRPSLSTANKPVVDAKPATRPAATAAAHSAATSSPPPPTPSAHTGSATFDPDAIKE